MEYRNLGNSGLWVSLVGLGCNNFGMRLDLEQTRRVVKKALDLGITLFDTADMYGGRGGSETQLGQILGQHRKDIILATKFGLPMDDKGLKQGASRRYIMNAIEDSLRRLRTDWIDLYQQHTYDPLVPLEETMRALDDLVTQGKVRYIGCSNLPAWQVVESQWVAKCRGATRFVSCQDEYNLLNQGIEKDLFPVMKSYEIGLLPYFPLASGLLTGKYQPHAMPDGARLTLNPTFANRVYISEENWGKITTLTKFGQARSCSLLEIAFGWLLAKPIVSSVIAGATSAAQIEANVQAMSWRPTPEELVEINTLVA